MHCVLYGIMQSLRSLPTSKRKAYDRLYIQIFVEVVRMTIIQLLEYQMF